MMIKSLSCKAQNPFNYLLDYFHKENIERAALTHNLIGATAHSAKKEMSSNIEYLSHRQGCNQAYHELLSLPKDLKIPRRRQAAMLEDIARYYLRQRAPKCLAYGVIHYDRAHLHMHLAITANNAKSRRRHSLSKAEFEEIRERVEAYKVREYPQLGRVTYYDNQARERIKSRRRDTPSLTHKEQSMKARTGNLSRKERDHFLVKSIFEAARSERQLTANLKLAGFSLYQRSKAIEGVQAIDGRKYRLRTLGLEASMLTARLRIKRFEERYQDLEKTPADSTRDRNRGRK